MAFDFLKQYGRCAISLNSAKYPIAYLILYVDRLFHRYLIKIFGTKNEITLEKF